jgi:hypothetical protein
MKRSLVVRLQELPLGIKKGHLYSAKQQVDLLIGSVEYLFVLERFCVFKYLLDIKAVIIGKKIEILTLPVAQMKCQCTPAYEHILPQKWTVFYQVLQQPPCLRKQAV